MTEQSSVQTHEKEPMEHISDDNADILTFPEPPEAKVYELAGKGNMRALYGLSLYARAFDVEWL